ncbi:MAG: toxin ParE1/3/4 [Pyrinomonadaceae bacterium]|jgi:plasmid stabilization system protein ParE|nr:toxin ParE1/3/4 [Pyrinomonadaceae bacterium]
MKIVWTDPAVEDLRELHAYIARDSEMYASGFVERIISAAERVAQYPNAGRVVPENNDASVREILYQHYRIIYSVKTEHIEMLTIIHGARDLGRLDRMPWEVS